MLDRECVLALVDDEHLDELAAQSGCPSRIGRITFTPDCVFSLLNERLEQRGASSVLEFRCGRGAFGRWLELRESTIRYSGVEESLTATEAARRAAPGCTFRVGNIRSFQTETQGAIACFSSLAEDALTIQDAQRLVSILEPNGTFFAGDVLFRDAQRARLAQSCFALRSAGCVVTYQTWTRELEGSILAMAATWLNSTRWPPSFRENVVCEARSVVDAIRERQLTYATIDAVRSP